MAKTSKQIQGDIYQLLRNDSRLTDGISGEVYREGYRPRDSKLEDAVVVFTTGTAGEIQAGVVTVLIYVPDIDPWGNGVVVEDGERTEAIEILANAWVKSLTADKSCYKFRTATTIATHEQAEIAQHFISIQLEYEFYGDDDAGLNI